MGMEASTPIRLLASYILGKQPGRGMLLAGILIVGSVAVMAITAPYISPYDPTKPSVPPELRGAPQPPSWEHPMGTTSLGYDVLSRIIYGSRIVLLVVLVASALSISIGVPLGLVSGYYGGALDRALSMVMDSIYAFPGIILAIAVATVLGTSPYNAAIALSVVYVPTYYRMVRGHVLELRETLFVEALKSLGLRDSRILARHVLPNTAPTILVVFGLAAADAILIEAGLSFFGLTVSTPTPDWGFDLYNSKEYVLNGYWWLIFFPGAMIMILALGFAMIGEGIADRLAIRVER